MSEYVALLKLEDDLMKINKRGTLWAASGVPGELAKTGVTTAVNIYGGGWFRGTMSAISDLVSPTSLPFNVDLGCQRSGCNLQITQTPDTKLWPINPE